MIGLLCLLFGHRWVAVTRTRDMVAKPGGMLPALDGYAVYRLDPDGTSKACTRCRAVRP